jgi:outer membrane protein TolC
MHKRRRAAVSAVTAALAAAALWSAAPLAAQDPRQPPLPQAAPVANQELSIEDALRLAESRSEAMRIARAGIQRARGQQYQARSQFLPQINASANYQRLLQSQFESIAEQSGGDQGGGTGGDSSLTNNPLAKVFASKNTMTVGVTGSQTLFAGGRVVAQNRVANASRRSAEIEVVAQRAQLALDVTQAYYDAALSERLLSIADSSLVQTENVLRQVRLARQVGSQSEFELLRAQVTRDNQVPQVVQARMNRDQAHYRLKQLLDIPLDAPLRLSTDIGDTATLPVGRTVSNVPAGAAQAGGEAGGAVDVRAVADTSAADRSSVRQSEAAVDVQRNLLRVARGQRLPSLQLSTNYQRFGYPAGTVPRALNQLYPNWTVSLGLSMPLFTGGRIRGEELVAQANLAEARAQLEQTRELAALDSRLALSQLEQAEAAFAASAGTAGQAQRAFQIAQVRFQEGISTQIELNDSRILLQQSQANRAQAARDLQVARTRLALLRDLPLIPTGVGQQQGFGQQGGLGARGGQSNTGTGQQQQQQSQPQQQGQPQGQGTGGTQQSAQIGGNAP